MACDVSTIFCTANTVLCVFAVDNPTSVSAVKAGGVAGCFYRFIFSESQSKSSFG
ncbi:hypothetical protein D515_04856 [Grimontia indica]|uniref:Uncharacterized protein n=1 Tax=Grimontia indica TaxID=1056512 RepID=R1ITT4_9GAMM|nr:hypothetical protein D515_04856 [Grimontia indica]